MLNYLNFIRYKHAKSNYWFKELGNGTCSNAIGQLCKIKPNLFCHSLIYRSVWADAQREASPVSECQQMFFWCHNSHAPSPPWGQPEVGSTQQRILPGKSSFSLLHSAEHLPSAIAMLNQGNSGIAGTGTRGEWGGQAVNKALPMDFTEHLLQGRTTNQGWFLPRPANLNPSKPAPGECESCTLPGTSSRHFQTRSCTGKRIPKHQAGGVRRVTYFNSFLIALIWLFLLFLASFNREYRIQIGKIMI